MKDVILTAQARWRMLIPILTLVAGAAIIVAMAYLERTQAAVFESNMTKVRDFRVTRMTLGTHMLRLSWGDAADDAAKVADDRKVLRTSLAHLGEQLKEFGADPDGITASIRSLLSDIDRLVQHDATWAQRGNTPEFKRTFNELDHSLSRLDSYNAGRLRILMADQRQQFSMAAGMALVLLFALGIFALRDHRRLNRAEQSLRDSESHLRQR